MVKGIIRGTKCVLLTRGEEVETYPGYPHRYWIQHDCQDPCTPVSIEGSEVRTYLFGSVFTEKPLEMKITESNGAFIEIMFISALDLQEIMGAIKGNIVPAGSNCRETCALGYGQLCQDQTNN